MAATAAPRHAALLLLALLLGLLSPTALAARSGAVDAELITTSSNKPSSPAGPIKKPAPAVTPKPNPGAGGVGGGGAAIPTIPGFGNGGIPGMGGFGNGGIPGMAGGGWGGGYGGPSGGYARGGVVAPTVTCTEKGPCYRKKVTCPKKCFSSYSGAGKGYGGGGGGGSCTVDCKVKCTAYC
ncbi:unnamed protein product [Urochloa decumbens]|uniref:Uncharacterized protein n=1 Tax=Urochloa decumbens TaxID=240449 RepID=A0ABC8X3S4_9POAL